MLMPMIAGEGPWHVTELGVQGGLLIHPTVFEVRK